MRKIKNVMLLVVCFLLLSGCNYENEDQVKKYIKEKHDIDVVVTDWGAIHEGNMGHTYHTVQAKNNKNMLFLFMRIFFSSSNVSSLSVTVISVFLKTS